MISRFFSLVAFLLLMLAVGCATPDPSLTGKELSTKQNKLIGGSLTTNTALGFLNANNMLTSGYSAYGCTVTMITSRHFITTGKCASYAVTSDPRVVKSDVSVTFRDPNNIFNTITISIDKIRFLGTNEGTYVKDFSLDLAVGRLQTNSPSFISPVKVADVTPAYGPPYLGSSNHPDVRIFGFGSDNTSQNIFVGSKRERSLIVGWNILPGIPSRMIEPYDIGGPAFVTFFPGSSSIPSVHQGLVGMLGGSYNYPGTSTKVDDYAHPSRVRRWIFAIIRHWEGGLEPGITRASGVPVLQSTLFVDYISHENNAKKCRRLCSRTKACATFTYQTTNMSGGFHGFCRFYGAISPPVPQADCISGSSALTRPFDFFGGDLTTGMYLGITDPIAGSDACRKLCQTTYSAQCTSFTYNHSSGYCYPKNHTGTVNFKLLNLPLWLCQTNLRGLLRLFWCRSSFPNGSYRIAVRWLLPKKQRL